MNHQADILQARREATLAKIAADQERQERAAMIERGKELQAALADLDKSILITKRQLSIRLEKMKTDEAAIQEQLDKARQRRGAVQSDLSSAMASATAERAPITNDLREITYGLERSAPREISLLIEHIRGLSAEIRPRVLTRKYDPLRRKWFETTDAASVKARRDRLAALEVRANKLRSEPLTDDELHEQLAAIRQDALRVTLVAANPDQCL